MTTIYARNYRKMEKLGLLAVINDLAEAEDDGYARIKSGGFMDLLVETLGRKGVITEASLSHYFKANGDLVPDPDMVVRIYEDAKMVEVLTYQDSFGFRPVYTVRNGGTMIDVAAKRDLNAFLGKWLGNLKQQGFDGFKARAGVQ